MSLLFCTVTIQVPARAAAPSKGAATFAGRSAASDHFPAAEKEKGAPRLRGSEVPCGLGTWTSRSGDMAPARYDTPGHKGVRELYVRRAAAFLHRETLVRDSTE